MKDGSRAGIVFSFTFAASMLTWMSKWTALDVWIYMTASVMAGLGGVAGLIVLGLVEKE